MTLPLFAIAIMVVIAFALTRGNGAPSSQKEAAAATEAAGEVLTAVQAATATSVAADAASVAGAATSTAVEAGVDSPVPPGILTVVTQVSESAFAAAGTTSAVKPMVVPPTDPVPAKPVFLYMGAEYCPFCAAQRWPMVIALSRFGQFSGLKLNASSSTDAFPDTPTFTFEGSTYSSPYIEFQAEETEGRNQNGDGSYPALDTPSANQTNLYVKYDAPPYVDAQNAGSIPFVLIGESYLWVGASYQPSLLEGMTWQTVADSLAQPTSDPAEAILANADMITAGICRMDGGQPGSVCNEPSVQAATSLLPPLKSS